MAGGNSIQRQQSYNEASESTYESIALLTSTAWQLTTDYMTADKCSTTANRR